MSIDHHIEKIESPSIKRVKIQNCSAVWNNDRVFRPIVRDGALSSAEDSPFYYRSVSITPLSTPKNSVKSTRPQFRCSSPTDEFVLGKSDSLLRRSLCPQPQAFE